MNLLRAPIWSPLFLHRKKLRAAVASLASSIATTFSVHGKRQLDLGCGTKPYKDFFSAIQVNYEGADLECVQGADVTIDRMTGVVNAPSKHYDLISHFQVLEHVPSPDIFLAECNRLLKDDGVMICTVPFLWEYHAVPSDYHRWTHEGLIQDFRKHGFETQTVFAVENEVETINTILQVMIGRNLGLRWTKPLFILLNLIGILLRTKPNLHLTLTLAVIAVKKN